jgi:chromosomal replication initiation ATPase DnaA
VLLDGRFRFENYVVGAANRLAVAAARAVAEGPGSVYNPLFIYSGSGLGKTHLIAALAHHARELQPELQVEYSPLEDFIEQLHAAVANGQSDALKRRRQQLDLLVLDDVQFLTGRRETQSELLRLFNVLHASGKQIVMASDRPPSEIADVDERLVTRLSGGLIVDIGVPDYETRVAILRRKSAERPHGLASGVLEQLARLSFANVRELQGALNRLVAHAALDGRPIAVEDVAALVGRPAEAIEPPREADPLEGPAADDLALGDEFASFLSDVACALAEHVDGWRAQLGERIAYWAEQGMRVEMLERALLLPEPPDIDALDEAFRAARDRLRALEAEAVSLDPGLAGHAAFRDPERLADAEALVERTIAAHDPPPSPLSTHRIDDVLRGATPLVSRATREVLEEPGARYNPLFVCGPDGAGKSRLAHALGHALAEGLGTDAVIACVSGAVFADELIAALESGRIERWRARYRAASALVIDDVDALAPMERTQDELFHLFNHLHEHGRQIVLTSAAAPGALDGLATRLRSRFEGGLVVTLEPARPRVADDAFLDPEKFVVEWPGLDGRLIEELR